MSKVATSALTQTRYSSIGSPVSQTPFHPAAQILTNSSAPTTVRSLTLSRRIPVRAVRTPHTSREPHGTQYCSWTDAERVIVCRKITDRQSTMCCTTRFVLVHSSKLVQHGAPRTRRAKWGVPGGGGVICCDNRCQCPLLYNRKAQQSFVYNFSSDKISRAQNSYKCKKTKKKFNIILAYTELYLSTKTT